MAGNSVIGALRVVLGADTAALDKGLKDAQGSLARFGKNVATIASGVGLERLVEGSVTAFINAMQSGLQNADKLGKMAQSVGVPVEELSKLKLAADLSDVSMEALGKSMGKLSRAMVEVAGGGGGAAKQAFEALGISVRSADGALKSNSVVLGEIAEKFKGYEDGAAKTALAIALFGRAGADLIPLLNAGKTGLQEMSEEAVQLGIVIDNKTAKSAEAFNDNLTRLGAVKQAFVMRITQELLPALQLLSQRMIDSAKDSTAFGAAAQGVANMLKFIVSEAVAGALAVQRLGAELTALWNAISSIGSGNFTAAWQGFLEAGKETERQFAKLKGTVAEFWSAAAAESEKVSESVGARIAAPVIKASEKAQNALESFLSSTAKRQAALTAELQTIGMSEAAQESLRIKLEALTIAKEKNITVTDAMRAKLDQAALSFGQMSQAVQEARTRWSFVEGSINTVASGLTDIAMRTKTAGEAFRDMALSIVRDFTQMIIKAQLLKLATSFMGGGFGGGPSFAGAGFANGIPQGVGLGGYAGSFASGGSFVVGGSGGIDSQIRTMRVTPGERVTVSKDGEGVGGAVVVHQTNQWTNVSPDMKAYVDRAVAQGNAAVMKAVPGMLQKQRGANPNLYGPG